MEEWRPVLGYEGFYEVSSLGSVRSVARVVRASNGEMRKYPGKVLRQSTAFRGYASVGLRKNTVPRTARVHVLVATAFLQRGLGHTHVRHLNGDPGDNRVENLAWGTPSENGLDTVRHGRNRKANQTHCVNGHEFTPENTATRRDRPRARVCRECARANGRRVYWKKQEMAA